MNEFETLYNFFMWFRDNGEKYLGLSIEKMIEIYLKEKQKIKEHEHENNKRISFRMGR